MVGSTYPFFQASTIDDLMNLAYRDLLANGQEIVARKGKTLERSGVLLELTNPRARLSRSETRGKVFSCLGELCWYLSATGDPDQITYYIAPYAELVEEDGRIVGAYGPRLFDWNGRSQFDAVVQILQARPTSRQAVIQLFDRTDLEQEYKDVPCTCSLQFFVREGRLDLIAHMRSSDAFAGLAHDVFCFTMLQELVCTRLGVELGTYRHFAGSFHLYERNRGAAQSFLEEGFQSTKHAAMPPIPNGDQSNSIRLLLQAERAIRLGEAWELPTDADDYWADLVRLLEFHRSVRDSNRARAEEISKQLVDESYVTFANARLERM